MSDARGPKRDGDLTDEQAAVLLRSFTETITEAGDIAQMLSRYVQAGGRDWETYERLLDHWARQGLKMVFSGRGALRPELGALSDRLITQAAGDAAPVTGMREHLHRKLAAAVLAMVWYAGEHHLIEAEDWPEELAAIVLAAVRSAPGINEDAMMKNL
ncbi:hypothetical protein IU459_29525 [Nocardia amamiensis]|uniref:TetR family transcriptional regulator n=1 Tax=Nocardia amamiensis TaxID=404578 RepID=A0ABS0D3B6_9NOCA|nr:hypothetical protein [Nocardia amamiensis]MBF6301649.1 hypothetical protein [Nocardia amamiensis]